ncbi:hypothetical protein BGX27_002211 [Mortierella sp. AM989]|nr:hypothetical protein BGX27_002211 [Mortierella sp. AM989]
MIASNQHYNHNDTASLSLDSWIYSLFSSCSDPIIACDLNGDICAWNQGAQRIFGISPKQSLGKNLNRLLNPAAAQIPAQSSAAAAILSDSELYPCTPEMVRALKGSSIKRIVNRTVQDQTQHQFLESISAVFEQQTGVAETTAATTAATTITASIKGANDINSNNKINNINNNNNNNSIGNRNIIPTHTELNGQYHSHIDDVSTPMLVGYSVILTDLSTLPISPVSPLHRPQLPLSSPAPISAPVPILPPPKSSLLTSSVTELLQNTITAPIATAAIEAATTEAIAATTATTATTATAATATATTATVTVAPTVTVTPTATTATTAAITPTTTTSEATTVDSVSLNSIIPSTLQQLSAARAHPLPITDKNDQESSFNLSDITSRPTTSREYSADSGFDERSSTFKPTSVVAAAPTAINGVDPVHMPRPQSDHLESFNVVSEPAMSAFQDLIPNLKTLIQPNRSNSISLPIRIPDTSSHERPSARSSSLGHLLPRPSSTISLYRPRTLSIAATAISYTSSGTQLSISMSSSPDKSRLDIHHNSLVPSRDDHHPSSLLSGEIKQEREWDDPYYSYLAPIATNLLTCYGDQLFDIVVEELAISLGVKYAFISQLVSLDELKELDPTEYMNLIEQFGGVVPPIDGVMHNISSWTGGSHVNPHAFQGYLADCTIQDKVTFLDAGLADKHQDVVDCLQDHTIESYVGMRLETAQGEIVGVIGIIHDKPLTEEDGMIVKRVLAQVGARVASELDRLKVEANLIYARDVAESTAKNKTKFLADMSHEIRQVKNPMNAVVGVTDILLDTVGLSNEQTSYIEVIRTSGQHLLTVINDILDISRIDQDVKFLLERRPLSLRKCLKDAVSLAGLTPLHDISRSISVIEWPPEMDDLGPFSELEETNILPLLWSIDQDVPEHLLGDITRLRQVLINLCTNSLKFTQRGRVAVHVSIHTPTAQHPTIRPNSSPMVTRSSPGIRSYHPRGEPEDLLSPSSSPMLAGADIRTPMVFQQRYDVRADGSSSVHTKPPPSRRRQADKRHVSASVTSSSNHDQASSSSNPPSLTVVAPTANSLKDDNMDENTVILEFAVSDTGVGIPANKITELFKSFSQVDISVSTRFGGTGLGLAISASLVEKMGGNIWVESTEGVGSRFTFTIPFTVCQSSETESHPSVTAPSSPVSTPARNDASSRNSNMDPFQLPAALDGIYESDQTEQSKEKTSETEKSNESTKLGESAEPELMAAETSPVETSPVETLPVETLPVETSPVEASKPLTPTYAKVVESNMKPLMIDGTPLRILLAEDNAVNQKVAVGVLKKLGYDSVDIAENGLEVIDKLDNGSIYDVILMDVSMPVMDGIDATKTIVERRKRGLLSSSENVVSAQSDDGLNPISTYKDYLNLYVIALTASAMGSDKERCMDAGMDDFMTKPFALLEMKRALNEFISKWNNGALKARNEASLASALAVKSRCNSPNCQGGLSALKDHNRSLSPTLGRSSSAGSNASPAEPGNAECSGCGGPMTSDCDSAATDGISGNSASSSNSTLGRTCRMETPRPLRRNLEVINCNLLAGRRSHGDLLGNGHLGSALGGSSPIAIEGANLARRASDAFFVSKREWRSGSGLGVNCDLPNGTHDIHPLDTEGNSPNVDQEKENGHNNVTLYPTHLRAKRVMSPSSLSKEHGLTAFRPMVSPLSPLSLLTTDTEGSSTISPPLSSSSSSSPIEAIGRSNESVPATTTVPDPEIPSPSTGV